MAMLVMAIIILLNIVLLLAVMRIGTREEHSGAVSADQSGAVRAWRARLAQSEADD